MENRTEYKVVIDTEIKGQESVEDLGNSVEETSGEFIKLERQIRKTKEELQKAAEAGDEVKFNKLTKELRDLEDSLEDVQNKSMKLEDGLAQLPGPAGAVGNAMKGMDQTMKLIAANPMLKTVIILTGLLFGLKKIFDVLITSMKSTEEGQAKLDKITSFFTKTMDGLLAVIQPVAEWFVDMVSAILENEKVMKVLEKTVGVLSATFSVLVSTGQALYELIVGNLVMGFNTLMKVGAATGKVLEGVFTLDFSKIKEGISEGSKAIVDGYKGVANNIITAGKDISKGVTDGITQGFDTGVKAFKKGYDKLSQVSSEEDKKLNEQLKKQEEERKKIYEEGIRVQTEAILGLLDERTRELTIREKKYNEDRKKLIAAGISDFTALEELYKKDVIEINRKWDKVLVTEQLKANQNRFDQISDSTEVGYDELIQLVNEKEQLLLSTITDSEADRTRVVIEAERARAKIRKDAVLKEVEEIDVRLKYSVTGEGSTVSSEISKLIEEEKLVIETIGNNQQLRLEIERKYSELRKQVQERGYDEEIRLIKEREELLLSQEGLTELQRTQILRDGSEQRAEVRARETSERLMELDNLLTFTQLSFDEQRRINDEYTELLLKNESLTEAERTRIKMEGAQERMRIDEMELQSRREIQDAYIDIVGQFGQLLQMFGEKNKGLAITGLVIESAANVARIIGSTFAAVAKLAVGLPFTAPLIAATKIAGALGVAGTIASTVKGIQEIKYAGPASSISGGTIGGNQPSTPVPQLEQTEVPQINVGPEKSGSEQISRTLAEREVKPVKAYVVESDISSEQALQRRTRNAAVFG